MTKRKTPPRQVNSKRTKSRKNRNINILPNNIRRLLDNNRAKEQLLAPTGHFSLNNMKNPIHILALTVPFLQLTSRKVRAILSRLIKTHDINAKALYKRQTAVCYLVDGYTRVPRSKWAYLDGVYAIFVSLGAKPVDTVLRKTKADIKESARKKYKEKKEQEFLNSISEWVVGNYASMQKKRRLGLKTNRLNNKLNNNVGKDLNISMAKFFRNKAHRAPHLSPFISEKAPKYLYRGMTGKHVATLLSTGRLNDQGYLAFSRRYKVAKNLIECLGSNTSVVLRVAVDTIPAGTPWLWMEDNIYGHVSNFNPKNVYEHLTSNNDTNINYENNNACAFYREREIVLPPGEFVLGTKIRGNFYNALYIPDRTATTIYGQKRIMPNPTTVTNV